MRGNLFIVHLLSNFCSQPLYRIYKSEDVARQLTQQLKAEIEVLKEIGAIRVLTLPGSRLAIDVSSGETWSMSIGAGALAEFLPEGYIFYMNGAAASLTQSKVIK